MSNESTHTLANSPATAAPEGASVDATREQGDASGRSSSGAMVGAQACPVCAGETCDACLWEGTREAYERGEDARKECLALADALYGRQRPNTQISASVDEKNA